MDKLKVGIVGVSGYGGGELARLLAGHPDVALTYVTSETYAGKPIQTALPGFAPSVNLACESFSPELCAEKCEFVFLAGEAGLAMRSAPGLLEVGLKIVDLSADFRLEDPSVYQTWYKAEHTAPHLLDEAVYGLPELNRIAIETARLVANPGCHVTAAVLALAPLLSADVIAPETIIIDSLSGVSGAGRSKFGLDYHFAELNESMRPYGVGGIHRHIPEIEQVLSGVAEAPVTVTFTPHLVPVTRGILSTVYAATEETEEDLRRAFQEAYQNEPFVTVLEAGQFPATKHVFGTNYCHIGLALDTRTSRVVVVSAIDNLVKGAAGQAVQNMNLMCGFAETAGLAMSAVWP
ncbi:MAG: N-acetyl-gamma-glutamyl-phosphate reductase [Janthinobacterium lividum]